MEMVRLHIVLVLLCTACSGYADTVICYNCNGTVEQSGTPGTACGWYKGWTPSNLDKRSAVLCPDGMCYTLVVGGTGQVSTVFRGCGQLTCDRLPKGWETKQEVCDSTTNRVKTPPAGAQLNEIRFFAASAPGKATNASAVQYCDADWCNIGGEQMVNQYYAQLAAQSQPPAPPVVEPTPAPPPVVPVVAAAVQVPVTNVVNNANSVVAAHGDPVTCYNCNGTVEQPGTRGTACGWYKGWTPSNLDKRTGVICQEGMCHTLVLGGAGQVSTVYRGCGQLTCDRLPKGWETKPEVCDIATNRVKPPPANAQFNEIRFFAASSSEKGINASAVQYCDTDWCSTGGEQMINQYNAQIAAQSPPPATPAPPAFVSMIAALPVQPAPPVAVTNVANNSISESSNNAGTSALATGSAAKFGSVTIGSDDGQTAPAAAGGAVIQPGKVINSCLQCRGQANDICGLRGKDLMGSVRTVNCNAGFCHIFVRAEAGGPVMVQRGCGHVLCQMIPGVNGGSRICDEYGRVPPIEPDNGLFNQTRSYYVPFAPGQSLQAGSLQYCDSGSNCNAGPIGNFPLKNYYYLENSAGGLVSSIVLCGAALVMAVIR